MLEVHFSRADVVFAITHLPTELVVALSICKVPIVSYLELVNGAWLDIDTGEEDNCPTFI